MPAKWGWVEGVTICIVLIPALTFLPFLHPARMLLRVLHNGIGLFAWLGILMSAKRRPPLPQFQARPWITFCAAWVGLEVFNPMGDLPLAAPAQAVMNLAVMAPIFWVPRLCRSADHVNRIVRILFACNLASLAFGFLQFQYPGQVIEHGSSLEYAPGRFDPPNIQIVEMTRATDAWEQLMITKANGQRVFRPFGLTDQPGGACVAASNCCLIAMAWIVGAAPFWKRLGYMGVAVLGLAMLYFCQVRTIYLVTVGGVGLLAVSLFLRRDFRALTILSVIGGAIFVAALAWAIRSGGDQVLGRFEALLKDDPTKVYANNRGNFLGYAFGIAMWEYPLGAGLGHWGMINYYFGRPNRDIYSELQFTAWIFDGGMPLLFGYIGAAMLAIWQVFRISLKARDPGFGKIACTVVGMASGIFVSGFSGMPFITPLGAQFWLMIGAILGAAQASAAPTRPRARA